MVELLKPQTPKPEVLLPIPRVVSIAARVADAGLRLAERGTEAADKAMQSAAALERGRLERWLAFLATVGNNAPFVGLFGTVVGVIHAFEELGHSAPGHAAAAGQVASQAVMSSIAEALVATAVQKLHHQHRRRVPPPHRVREGCPPSPPKTEPCEGRGRSTRS